MTARFEIQPTRIHDLHVITRMPVQDARGSFERLFCAIDLGGLTAKGVVQINRSLTVERGTVRGMHFQYPPHAETKFICCLKGAVYDVAIDLREGSPTLCDWHAELLSESDHKLFAIPPGFAHGFQTLSDDCELLYFHTEYFRPEAEGAINALDPRIDIEWPEPISIRSARDSAHPMLGADFKGIPV